MIQSVFTVVISREREPLNREKPFNKKHSNQANFSLIVLYEAKYPTKIVVFFVTPTVYLMCEKYQQTHHDAAAQQYGGSHLDRSITQLGKDEYRPLN